MPLIESLTGLPLALFALAALMTFGAAAIRGLTGFGMAIVLVPLLGMIMRPDKAVMLAIVLQLLIGPVGLNSVLRESHRASALPIALLAMAATPFGVLALAHTPPDLARLLIAAIAMGAFFLLMLSFGARDIPGRIATVSAGITAGLLTGFAAMPGPPVVPFYLREAFAPVTARASMMFVFFGTAIAGTMAAWLLGMLTQQIGLLAILLFLPMVAGNALGQKGFGMVSAKVWRSAVGALLGLAGLSALWRVLH